MRYRSRNDIAAEILRTCQIPALKTKIMYQAYLSYQQLTEYLAQLTETEMLTYDKVSRCFSTTEKGSTFLHQYEKMKVIFDTEKKKGTSQRKKNE